jgi:hypothetical protein
MKLKFNKGGWTDWIQHDHKGCPVVGWYVKAEVTPKIVLSPSEGIAVDNGYWSDGKNGYKVVRYKVRKPLGASKLEEMLKDLPKVVDNRQPENT